MKDFVIVQYKDLCGYISTDKKCIHGFEQSRAAVIMRLERFFGEYSYACEGEKPTSPNQREFTKRDKIYANKLAHAKTKYEVEYAVFLSKYYGGR